MAIPHTALETKAILARLGLKPERRLGQNFLVDERTRDRVITAAGIRPDETILEIGPGLGALTEALARHARRVVAIEKDGRLVDFLTGEFAGTARVMIVNGDIRRVDLAKLVSEEERNAAREARGAKPRTDGWSVVASPPYYLVAFLVRKLLDLAYPPRHITLVVQKEVADRLAAGAGEMNLLALAAQLASRVAKHDRISRRAFWPQPDVDSTIVTLASHAPDKRPIPAAQEEEFFNLVRPLFQTRRKQLAGSLGRTLKLTPPQTIKLLTMAHIPPEARPQEISVDKWVRLFRILEAHRI
ncbi:ribosomal RNA small subunit methyltransferase A [Candidatus Parcubacteria bacterium]|nr:ribosomal RNA small subunit methyltransferase A [Candidatus Parcubacteria bacterium]